MVLCAGVAPVRGWAAEPPGQGMPAEAVSPHILLTFDLPRMPLAEALIRYGEISGRSVLYETGSVAGKYAAPLKGRFTLDAALSRLLTDTGLRARALSAGSVTVAPVPSAAPAKMPSARLSAMQRQYDGYMQQRVFGALCAYPELQADRQRIVLRFSVNVQRRIVDLRVRMAEQPALEPVVRRILDKQFMDAPPPGVAQPVLMLISPEAAARWGGCSR